MNTYQITVNPGSVFKFEGGTAGITVGSSGSFSAVGLGTTTGMIYFTSIKDDKVGGDTNGDGTATTSSAGDWDRIAVLSTASADLKYAIVRYGGSNATLGSVSNGGGTLNIANSEISTTTRGVSNSAGTLTVLACNIHDNSYGLDVSGGIVSIGSSNIHGNSLFGLNNTGTATTTARYNYWGTSTGPYNATYHATGTGDTVSNKVDFVPWLSVVHYLSISTSSKLISAVDATKHVYWNGTTTYPNAWYGAVGTWNAQAKVGIATSSGSNQTLALSDASSTSLAWSALYTAYYRPAADTIQFNSYQMNQMPTTSQRWTATHELGHALGLAHSYWGNVMNSYVTEQITLGGQDVSDYSYLWQ